MMPAENTAAYMRTYRLAHGKEILISAKNYRDSHKEEIKTDNNSYRAMHRKELAARSRAYYHTHREERKAYAAKHKEKHAAYSRQRLYGLSQIAFNALLDKQGGVCAACGSSKWGHYGPVVDHDHGLGGTVRGILCNPCNLASGILGDDPIRVDNLAVYLRNNGKIWRRKP